jgi:hypothetical protein
MPLITLTYTCLRAVPRESVLAREREQGLQEKTLSAYALGLLSSAYLTCDYLVSNLEADIKPVISFSSTFSSTNATYTHVDTMLAK